MRSRKILIDAAFKRKNKKASLFSLGGEHNLFYPHRRYLKILFGIISKSGKRRRRGGGVSHCGKMEKAAKGEGGDKKPYALQ